MATRRDAVREQDETQVESALAELVQAHGDHGSRWLMRKPVVTARIVRLLQGVPRLVFTSSGSLEGEMIRGALDHGPTSLQRTKSVLDLSFAPGSYSEGRRRVTQRRKARKARKAGVSHRPVVDAHERFRLLDLANSYERVHPDLRYRSETPDNDDLLGVRLWLLAELDGSPLMLVVAASDGEWAMQRYFRTLSDSPAASDTRYLMTEVLAETLAAEGVRHLVDASNPLAIPPGLRHFARMVGFRYCQIRVKN